MAQLRKAGTFDSIAAVLAAARQETTSLRERMLIDRIISMICDEMEERHDRFIRSSFCRRAKYQHDVPIEHQDPRHSD